MALDEETLQRVADDGHMIYEKWPDILEPFLERINHIVYTEFPIPKPYSNIYRPRQTISPQQTHSHLDTPQNHSPTANGPTIPATPTPSRNLPPVPLFPSTSSNTTPTTSQIPDSLPPTTQPSADQPPELPQPVLQLLDGILKSLRTSFSNLPPHTIQRLAELILNPTKHYRTLPAWLRAVDRVISVTSTADIFPLPRAMPLPSHVIDSSLLTNGVHSEAEKSVLGEGGGGILWLNETSEPWNDDTSTLLGSDESLGGALLTPIPWLRNGVAVTSSSEGSTDFDSAESDDLLGGPIELPVSAATTNGNALVPEREDGAVTQGELIRQEQEAGVVPVGHSDADSRGMMLDDDEEGEDEVPHARGPGVMGAVDVGKVDGKDMEVNVGNQDVNTGVGRGVRDAQEVLSGGATGSHRQQEAPPGRGVDADEMEVDADSANPAAHSTEGAAATLGVQEQDSLMTDSEAAKPSGGPVEEANADKSGGS